MLDAARRRAFLIAFVLLAFGVALGWIMAGGDETGASLAQPAQPWRQPEIAISNSARALAQLQARSPWEAAAATAPGVGASSITAASSWHLSGIIAESGVTTAVILVAEPGKPGNTQYRIAGDVLPDGSRIVDITDTAMTIETGGNRRQVKLFFPN